MRCCVGRPEDRADPGGLVQEELVGVVCGREGLQLGATQSHQVVLHVLEDPPVQSLEEQGHITQCLVGVDLAAHTDTGAMHRNETTQTPISTAHIIGIR